MKILIIGGNRFFGKKLAQRLLKNGHQLTLFNRGNFDDGLGPNINRIKCDRENAKDLATTVGSQKWDIVYDQVCFTAHHAADAVKTFQGKVGHYVFTSSMSVYGRGQNLTEADFDPVTHVFDNMETKDSDYAEAKRQCEATFFKDNLFPVTAVRFPIVLGADDRTKRLHFHVERAVEGKDIYFPSIKSKISFISSDDAAATLESVGFKEAMGPVNAASEKPISLKNFVREIEAVVGKPVNVATTHTEENHSPYGIEDDWYMNIQRLVAFGFRPNPIEEWLANEVRAIAQGRKKTPVLRQQSTLRG